MKLKGCSAGDTIVVTFYPSECVRWSIRLDDESARLDERLCLRPGRMRSQKFSNYYAIFHSRFIRYVNSPRRAKKTKLDLNSSEYIFVWKKAQFMFWNGGKMSLEMGKNWMQKVLIKFLFSLRSDFIIRLLLLSFNSCLGWEISISFSLTMTLWIDFWRHCFFF